MSNNAPTKEKTATIFCPKTEITERKIGGTTYIVTSKYKEDGKEGLLDKIWRLIQYDAENY